MKKLLLIRHAEAVGYTPNGDFHRPLSTKGEQQPAALAQNLQQSGFVPQHLVSSPALRTQTTVQIIANSLHLSTPEYNEAIYEASEETLLQVVNHFNPQLDFVGLIGHNPGISYLLYNLTGEIRDIPPCTAVVINFEVDDWESISPNTGTLIYYNSPDSF
ncbi:histidine phosphatase family protein [Mucilaginibacter robiniae]|uniref:Histidine phosphatase family protein n=1 Tax=Mucilaginibacter robiniae TaxID=2728022 RepID=A0A7L5E4H4_9SPHI|nr:histidine phosphatase family protein [Mucilaginibacter robiniae]QJD97498.1 histidine phosphatase family protein [Mucilaginibacter robiniae]